MKNNVVIHKQAQKSRLWAKTKRLLYWVRPVESGLLFTTRATIQMVIARVVLELET